MGQSSDLVQSQQLDGGNGSGGGTSRRGGRQSKRAPSSGFSIDVSQLGGMYANQLYLNSSDVGLGVNSTGRLSTQQGSFTLFANGDVTLAYSYSTQAMQINAAGQVNLNGVTQSLGNMQIAAAQAMSNNGTVDAVGTLNIGTGSILNDQRARQFGWCVDHCSQR